MNEVSEIFLLLLYLKGFVLSFDRYWDDYDADEPMMPLSGEFSDLEDGYLEDVEDNDSDTPPPSSLKQYMPMKPIKRGIKVWALADSHNGYFHYFQVYTGKEGSGEKHLGQRVVKNLTKHFRGKNHHVVFDIFTREQLLCDLAADIYACGTAQKNRRGFPPSLKSAKLNRSAYASA